MLRSLAAIAYMISGRGMNLTKLWEASATVDIDMSDMTHAPLATGSLEAVKVPTMSACEHIEIYRLTWCPRARTLAGSSAIELGG